MVTFKDEAEEQNLLRGICEIPWEPSNTSTMLPAVIIQRQVGEEQIDLFLGMFSPVEDRTFSPTGWRWVAEQITPSCAPDTCSVILGSSIKIIYESKLPGVQHCFAQYLCFVVRRNQETGFSDFMTRLDPPQVKHLCMLPKLQILIIVFF